MLNLDSGLTFSKILGFTLLVSTDCLLALAEAMQLITWLSKAK